MTLMETNNGASAPAAQRRGRWALRPRAPAGPGAGRASEAASVLGGVQAGDPARGRGLLAAGRGGGAPAPRGALHLAPLGVAQAARPGRAAGACPSARA